jgi:WD40 repeat protein
MPRWRTLILVAALSLLAAACATTPRPTPTYTILRASTATALPSATATPLPPTATPRQPAGLPHVTNTPRPSATNTATLEPWTPPPYTPPAPNPLALSPANAAQMQELAVLGQGHISSIAFSPDRRLFVVITGLGMDLYDTQTWKLAAHYPDIAEWAVFDPSGNALLLINANQVSWFDLAAGHITRTYYSAIGRFSFAVFSPGGSWLALSGVDFPGSGDPSYLVEVLNAATGERLFSRSAYPATSPAIAFSPDGRSLALTDSEETLLLDADTGAVLDTFRVAGYAVRFTPDGATLVVTAGEQTLAITLANGVSRVATAMPTSPPSTPDVWFDDVGRLQVTDLTTHELLPLLPYTPGLTAVAFGPPTASGSPTVLAGDWYGASWSWDLNTGAPLSLTVGGYDYNGPNRIVTGLGYSEAQHVLLTSFTDGTIRATLPAQGMVPYGLTCPISDGARLALAGDTVAAVCDSYNSVQVWSVATGEWLALRTGQFADVVEWRGEWFGVMPERHSVALLPVTGATVALSLPVLDAEGAVEWLVASPDGRWLAGSAESGNIVVWNADTAQLTTTLVGHQSRGGDGGGFGVTLLRFSPNTNLLASTGEDNTLRLWDITTGLELRRFEIAGLSDMAFSADGRYLAVSSRDGVVRVYGLPSL